MKEQPLVIYTLLAQAAAGLVWAGLASAWLALPSPEATSLQITAPVLLAAGPLAIVSMLASLLHLQDPLGAPRAISAWRTSWLSREVLSTAAFTASWGLSAFALWLKWGLLAWAAGVLAALFGFAMVYSMARLYRLASIPAWDTWLTPISFFLTAWALGSTGAATLFTWFRPGWPTIPTLAWSALVTLAVQAGLASHWSAHLTNIFEKRLSPAMKKDPPRPPARLFSLRSGLALIAAIILAAALAIPEAPVGLLLIAALLLALASEAIGRWIFYAVNPGN